LSNAIADPEIPRIGLCVVNQTTGKKYPGCQLLQRASRRFFPWLS